MRSGYTIIELMVTIVIVTALAVTVGTFFVKLLTIQERDREEAYVREKLADLCAVYSDFASIGSSFSINSENGASIVSYRQETGGLSFETGRVSRVAYLTMVTTNQTMDLDVYAFKYGERSLIFHNEKENLVSKWARFLSGDASLLTLPTSKLDVKKVTCALTPIGTSLDEIYKVPDGDFIDFNVYSNAALANLRVEAWYTYKNGRRESVMTNAAVERLVRLWNHR